MEEWGRMDQKKRKCAVSSAILLAILCMLSGCTRNKKLAEGFLAFNYDVSGKFGSLYFQDIKGKKIEISEHALGDDESFLLDKERGLVTYLGENNTLFICKIGEQPVKVRENINNDYNNDYNNGDSSPVISKDKYFIYSSMTDEGNLILFFYDKDSGKEHFIQTACPSISEVIIVDDEEIYYEDQGVIYYSEQFESPQVVINGGSLLTSSDEENDLFFFDYQVSMIDNEPVAFCKSVYEELYAVMQNKGKQLLMDGVRQFEYVPEIKTLFFLNAENAIVQQALTAVDGVELGESKTISTIEAKSFQVVADGKYICFEGDGPNSNCIYLKGEGKELLIDDEIEKWCISDDLVVYTTVDEQCIYVKKLSDLLLEKEETAYTDDIIGKYDTFDEQRNTLFYLTDRDGQVSLMYYGLDQGKQTLLEDVNTYNLIKYDRVAYYSPMRAETLSGYYYSEHYDALVFFSKDEMVIYNEGVEKGRIGYQVEEDEVARKLLNKQLSEGRTDENKRACISPKSKEAFTVELIRKGAYFKPCFLTNYSLLIQDYWRWLLIMGDERIELDALTEEAFNLKLEEQKKQKEKQQVLEITHEEACVFVDWYMTCILGEDVADTMLCEEDDRYFVIEGIIKDTPIKKKFKVDKQNGKVIPFEPEEKVVRVNEKNKVNYEIIDNVLWMKEEDHKKARLYLISSLYDEHFFPKDQWYEILGSDRENVYFLVGKKEDQDEYCWVSIYRYDLLEHRLIEVKRIESAFYGIDCKWYNEDELYIEYGIVRHYLDRICINKLTGEVTKSFTGDSLEEGNMCYKILSPKLADCYYICEINKETGEERLLCKKDIPDYYAMKRCEYFFKVGDAIYFNDYTYYWAEEEKQVAQNPPLTVYCKVDVHTGEVKRVTEEEIKKQYEKVKDE